MKEIYLWNYLHFKKNVALFFPLCFRNHSKAWFGRCFRDPLVSLSVAGLRFDYSEHCQAEPRFFFQQEDSTTSVSDLFQSSDVLTEYFSPCIHLYFPLQQLVPITYVL